MTWIILILAALSISVLYFVLAFRPAKEYRFSEKPQQLRDLIKHSKNSNAFLTLYPGFQYFQSKKTGRAVVAFVDTGRAWVAATSPLAEGADWGNALITFARSAQSIGKSAMFLPMSKVNAERAKAFGYGTLMIGSEPVFELDRYEPNIAMVPAAKALQAKGAKVLAFKPSGLSKELRDQCDQIIESWLATRKIDALSFLNRVAPWELSDDKRYFYVHLDDQILAFAALIPIWGRNGWYLIDLLRKPTSPPGSADLVVLESIRALKEEGFREVTLGVAPLSNLHFANRNEYRFTYFILNLFFERITLFYRFKSLYQFKIKFKPTRFDPAYLVFSPANINVIQTLSLLEAFFPGGIFNATWSFLRRFMGRVYLWDWIDTKLSPNVITRPWPRSRDEWISRMPVTLSLFFINLLFFPFTRGAHGRIDPWVLATWGFSWKAFTIGPLGRILTSPFLHLNAWHLGSNLALLFVFTGLLETVGGSSFAFLSFLFSALFTNLLTVLIFAPLLDFFHPPWAAHLMSDFDIGASLGIFGCAGSLIPMLKYPKSVTISLLWLVVAIAIGTQTPLALNHAVALGIGALVASVYLSR